MPRPILLSCENVTKSFGGPPLFSGLTFSLHEGDHVGLVGPNGAGKSTLLKLMGGLEQPDSGACTRRRNLRVGYVPQTPVFDAGTTARGIVAAAVAQDHHLDGHEQDQAVSMALSRAGFADPDVRTGILSGGWRARLAITRAVAGKPDILLLDEPTNHLDIESILWLESILRDEAGAFVAISHDRYFLERVAGRMLEINKLHAAGLFASAGTYADFLEARDLELSNQDAYRDSLAGLVRREVAWLRRGAKARTTKSKARIQTAERSIEQLEESRARASVRTTGIEFNASGRKTNRLWSGESLRIGFEGRTIVENLDLLLTPGTRCGVLGPNGSGKTTLLRTIVGDVPALGGEIHRADALRIVYFDQNRDSLEPGLTLKRALAPDGDSVIYRDRMIHVASWARRFLFNTGQLEAPVSALSGGERARIVLARMMLRPADLLVLDEPTNDLDIPALEVLEEALLEFPGALVLVSHDRFLLDRVSTQVLALDGRGVARHYADYGQWESAGRMPATSPSPSRKDTWGSPAPKPARAAARKLTYLEQREWDGMEAAVLAAEEGAAEARRRAEDPSIAADAAALHERHRELDERQAVVDRLYARWAELDEKQRKSTLV